MPAQPCCGSDAPLARHTCALLLPIASPCALPTATRCSPWCWTCHLTGRKVISGASGATHEVTVEQMVCRSASAQLSIYHPLTSRHSKAFPVPSQGSTQGPQLLPHPNPILLGWSHFAACWGKFSPLFCRHQRGRKSSSPCVQK